MTSPNPADDQDKITALLAPAGLLDEMAATPANAVSWGSAVTPTAAIPAQDRRSDTAKIESSWARMHTAGMADTVSDTRLQLWNFGVGSAVLKPGHVEALKALLAAHAMGIALAPGAITAQIQGSASETGSERSNGDLAAGRAQAVADWLQVHGVPTARITSLILPAPGNSGEGLAAVRAVFVTLVGAGQSPAAQPAPSPAPATTLVPQSATATPDGGETSSAVATLSFPYAATTEVQLAEFVVMVPPNEWVEGELKFTGKITIRSQSEEDLARFKGALQRDGGGEVTAEATAAVSEWLKVKVEAGAEQDESAEWAPKAAVSALLGDTKWEAGLQISENPIFVKSPENRLFEVRSEDLPLGLGPGVVVELTGQFEFEGRPGPAAIEAAGAALASAPELVTATLFAGTLGSLYWLASTLGNPQALGDARAAIVAARYGFAAEAARETISADARDVDAFLKPYQKGQPCDAFAGSVTSGQSSAAAQLAALQDGKAARLANLKAKYATDSKGNTLDYAGVAEAMLNALGGVSVGSDPPQLEHL